MDGPQIIEAATQLVLDALRANRQGLTNAELDTIVHLNLPIRRQRGYITWTILQYLVEQGRVVKDGPIYRLTR